MPGKRIELGRRGEDLAADFLKRNGYRVLLRNYKTKLGEIDIIAKDKDTLCFVEVKARYSDRCGLPQESVSQDKQKKISRLAVCFLKENNLLESKARFDVVSVAYCPGSAKLDLFKNAFDLDTGYTF